MAANVDSKPSKIKSGWFGSASSSSLNPNILDFPRISMFGKRFGSEPNWLSSRIAKAGSSVFKLCRIFCVPIVFNSAAE